MLASHLSPTGRTAVLPQLQSSKAITSTAVLRSMNLGRSPWCHQQTRGIKVEYWSWYLHPDSQKDQGRHRIWKSAYIEALNRKLLRHRHHRMHISHSSIKNFMCSALQESKSSINLQKLKHDATRTASNLARAVSASISSSGKDTTDGHNGRTFSSDETQSPNLEYDIDPITNRKVFKHEYGLLRKQVNSHTSNIPVKKFDSYRSPISQVSDSQSLSKHSTTTSSGGAPTPPSQSKTSYVTDSELYRDGRTVEEELGVYKPFQHNEPDGQLPFPPDPVEQALNDGRTLAEELGIYKPFRHNEPDGHLPLPVDSAGGTLGDGRKLAEELRIYKPFQHNEPDGHLPIPPDPVEQALNEYDQKCDPELNDYKPFRHNEPDGHLPLAPDPVQYALSEYDQKWEPRVENDNFFFDEDFEAERSAKLELNTSDSWNKLKWFNSAATEKSPFGFQAGLQSSEAINGTRSESEAEKQVRTRKMEEDFDASSSQFTKDIEAVAKGDKARSVRKRAQEFEVERSELLNHHGHLRGRVDARLKEIAALDRGEASQKPVLNCTSELFPDQTSSAKENLQKRRSVTGNFVRDFPEEHAVSWESNGGPLLPKSAQSGTVTESPSKAGAIHVSEFSRNAGTPRLQTSLERNRAASKGIPDPSYSTITKPIDLQDSYANDCAKNAEREPLYVSSYGTDLPQAAKAAQNTDTTKRNVKDGNGDKLKTTLANELRRIYEDTYGAIGPLHRQTVDQFSPKGTVSSTQSTGNGNAVTAPNPTFYKILAYSPDTQSILTTETTSIVPPDNQKPLSPATVLLRLSKPAKFLPHIAPLLKEGYEIASGNGLVLVFRKVRDGPPTGRPVVNAEPDTHVRKMTNPIDGMQSIRPATGNFASPTGFVNHDLPEYHTEPFNTGMDTGHEGHIYDSSKADWQDQEWEDREARKRKGRKRVKKLLIGAVWVGGLSYAIGVVAEFFRTGGTDGNGAVGL